MKDTGKKSIGPLILVIVLAVLLLRKGALTGIIATGIKLVFLLGLLVVILAIVGVVYAIRSGKKDYDQRNGKVPGKKQPEVKAPSQEPVPDEKEVKQPERNEAPEIAAARATVAEIDKILANLTDVEVKARGTDARCSLLRLLDTMSDQPEEIKKNRQLFAYYIPTFKEIAEKYRIISQGGVDNGTAREKAVSSFDKLQGVFEKMYGNLYDDEQLDLSVEERALESIIRKDGY